jgi:hypothetical protein
METTSEVIEDYCILAITLTMLSLYCTSFSSSISFLVIDASISAHS